LGYTVLRVVVFFQNFRTPAYHYVSHLTFSSASKLFALQPKNYNETVRFGDQSRKKSVEREKKILVSIFLSKKEKKQSINYYNRCHLNC